MSTRSSPVIHEAAVGSGPLSSSTTGVYVDPANLTNLITHLQRLELQNALQAEQLAQLTQSVDKLTATTPLQRMYGNAEAAAIGGSHLPSSAMSPSSSSIRPMRNLLSTPNQYGHPSNLQQLHSRLQQTPGFDGVASANSPLTTPSSLTLRPGAIARESARARMELIRRYGEEFEAEALKALDQTATTAQIQSPRERITSPLSSHRSSKSKSQNRSKHHSPMSSPRPSTKTARRTTKKKKKSHSSDSPFSPTAHGPSDRLMQPIRQPRPSTPRSPPPRTKTRSKTKSNASAHSPRTSRSRKKSSHTRRTQHSPDSDPHDNTDQPPSAVYAGGSSFPQFDYSAHQHDDVVPFTYSSPAAKTPSSGLMNQPDNTLSDLSSSSSKQQGPRNANPIITHHNGWTADPSTPHRISIQIPSPHPSSSTTTDVLPLSPLGVHSSPIMNRVVQSSPIRIDIITSSPPMQPSDQHTHTDDKRSVYDSRSRHHRHSGSTNRSQSRSKKHSSHSNSTRPSEDDRSIGHKSAPKSAWSNDMSRPLTAVSASMDENRSTELASMNRVETFTYEDQPLTHSHRSHPPSHHSHSHSHSSHLSKKFCAVHGCQERKMKGKEYRFCQYHENPSASISNPNARQQRLIHNQL